MSSRSFSEEMIDFELNAIAVAIIWILEQPQLE